MKNERCTRANHPGLRAGAIGLVALLAGAACAGNPGPGEKGWEWNLDGTYETNFVVAGASYTGEANLETVRGGAVTGDLNFKSPVVIVGTVEGVVQEAAWRFKATYERDSGCVGEIEGVGIVEKGGDATAGTLDVLDSCSDQPLSGTFSLRRPQ